ncbi:MAG TPA: bifunctional UDP-sugar hydrolase/5'-nucleotidase [Longimicrobiaceae bacterium]|nr:bifunctional UDP-sugar hydrolase/5'-nucleotidase [Longimicrobiaceae bacterium]
MNAQHSFVFRAAAPLLAALAAACAPPPPAAPAPEPVKRVRIVHTNDFHGRLHPQRPSWAGGREVGGSAVLAAHFDSAAARFDGPTFFLSAGDDLQGTAISNLSWGRATVAAHNATGYHAAAVGNHEFDWGLDTLRARIAESRFPWLGANVYVAGTQRQPEWLRPWTMLERDGVRVAVIGAAISSTPTLVMAGRTEGLEFGPEAPAIDRSAREARAAGADFVVVSVHTGARCEGPGLAAEPRAESTGCTGEVLEMAEQLTEPVDLVLGGHTHHRVLTTAAGIPVAEASSYSTAYSVTDLERRGDSVTATYRAVHPAYADQVSPDTMVARVVAEWDANVRPISERVVVHFAAPMERQGPEYALGNLIADAFRATAGARVALINTGSIRRAIPAGPATYGVLYELQPFQNELVTLTVTGAQLRAALEHALGRDGRPDAHLSGMTVAYDSTAAQGSRVREVRLADGRALRDTDTVTVATTEFVATGGDGYTTLKEGRMTRTGRVDLDALIEYLRAQPQPVRPPRTGRWVAR